MRRLNKFGMSLAVISALSFGFTGCGSSSSAASGLGEMLSSFVYVSRGDVYGATVVDANGQVGVQVEGENKYEFENTIEYPITVNGGYVDVNGDGEITADVDMKLNIEMKSYTDTVTPVTTYLADEADAAARELKLDELVALVKDLTDVDAVTADDLLKAASDTTADAQIVINAIYAEMVEAGSTDLDLSLDVDNDVKADFEARLKELDELDLDTTTAEKQAAELETYIVDELRLDTLSQDEVIKYLNDTSAKFFDSEAIKTVSDLQGQTVYTIDTEANPVTYTEIKISESLDSAETKLETTTYELDNGEWEKVQSDVEATATLVNDELTLVINDGEQEIKNVIDEISLDGFSLETDFSVKDLGSYLGANADFSAEEDGEIYLEMTAEMKSPELID